MFSGGGDEKEAVVGGGGAELNRRAKRAIAVGLAGAEEDQIRGVDVVL
jgi:hypothetical protein